MVRAAARASSTFETSAPPAMAPSGRPPPRPPVLYAAGDSIRFVPIDRARYDELAAAVAAGTYIHQVTEESI